MQIFMKFEETKIYRMCIMKYPKYFFKILLNFANFLNFYFLDYIRKSMTVCVNTRSLSCLRKHLKAHTYMQFPKSWYNRPGGCCT